MSKSKRGAIVPKPSPGGGLIAVDRRELTAETARLTLNLAQLPAPQRRYLAEVVEVCSTNGMIQLMFGQRKVGSESLRSLIIVTMFPQVMRDFLGTCEPMKPSLEEYFAKGAPRLELSRIVEEPTQTVALTATLIAVAFVGEETCLDCYSISPFAHRAAMQGAPKIPVDPVVRVDLHTSLFAAMLARLGALQNQFTTLLERPPS